MSSKLTHTASLFCLVLLVSFPLLSSPFFVPDDYRYLYQVQSAERLGAGEMLNAMVVENRWDQNWWIPSGTMVRFFRPLVILSYYLEYQLWGLQPLGFVVSNITLHFAAVLLAYVFFQQLLGDRRAAFIGAALFAVRSSHFEHLAFVAARTDTFAGIAFLLTITAYLQRRHLSGVLPVVQASFFLSLLAKEYSVIIPACFLCLDYLLPSQGNTRETIKRRIPFYAACGATLLAYLFLRNSFLGDLGSGTRPYPYFFMPGRDGIFERTLVVWLFYSASFASGALVSVFQSTMDDLFRLISYPEVLLGAVWLPAVIAASVWNPRGRWLVFVFLLSFAPLLPLYSSGRYLYTASIAYSGLMAMLVCRLFRQRKLLSRLLLAVLLLLQIAVPSLRLLGASAAMYDQKAASGSHPPLLAEQLFKAGFPKAEPSTVYLLDYPYHWVSLQFLPYSVGAISRHPKPMIRPLTRALNSSYQELIIRQLDEQTLRLSRENGARLIDVDHNDFDQIPIAEGEIITMPNFKVSIVKAVDAQAHVIDIRFAKPLSELAILQFTPPANPQTKTWIVNKLTFP